MTNGIGEIQRGRMRHSPLGPLISALVISEEVGAPKPDARMIRAALDALGGVAPRDALMVGDSLTSDMRCAMNAGTDACWYNPGRAPRPDRLDIRYEIHALGQLPAIALSERSSDQKRRSP